MNIFKIDHQLYPEPPLPPPALYGDRRRFLQSVLVLGASALGFPMSAPALAAQPLKIVALGDSLTAGYRLAADQAFPAVLEKKLRADGLNVSVVNAGVSGDTAEDGLARFDWSFADGADGAILELGANDMLRGFDPKRTRDTLDTILTKLKERHIPVLIAGMLASPNLGADYKQAFDSIYPDLARKYDAPLYPFFLEGVANVPGMQLDDKLHPNPQGVEHMVANMLPMIELFVKSLPGHS